MSTKKLNCVVLSFVLVLLGSVELQAQLQVGFYGFSCSIAEIIVKNEVRNAVNGNRGLAAGLVRLHFHDCFVRGCEGSVLVDSTSGNTAEKDSPANNPSLRGFEVIDRAKATLETLCPRVVSCADIVAFAARDSVEMAGGFGYDVPAGRRDGRVSLIAETRDLPPSTSNVNQLTQMFSNKGLTQDEMVTLSGKHYSKGPHNRPITLHFFHQQTLQLQHHSEQDPSLDPTYAAQLKQQCPQGSTNANLVVPMNPSTPNTQDVGYYVDVLNNRGLFTSDQTLLTSTATANQVTQNAGSPFLWQNKFAAAMVKMGRIGVLTGSAGEIRTNCRVIN